MMSLPSVSTCATSLSHASYLNRRPVSSFVMFPLLSKVGGVAPAMVRIWLRLLCVRARALPLLLKLSQLPSASSVHACVNVGDGIDPPTSVPRLMDDRRLRLS